MRTSSRRARRCAQTAAAAAEHLGLALGEIESPVALTEVRLATPRVRAPQELAEICASDDHTRASHAMGKSYTDVVNGFRGRFEHPPDFVASPRDERDVERLLEWCESERVAAIPFGGGTSVVGGVTRGRPRLLQRRDRDSTCARWIACWRSTRCRARRASRRARPVPAWRPSWASTASRCATSRSRLSTRRSAAGSPRARPATSRR